MVSDGSYWVYDGGRWHALDTASGRVEGLGRARFLVSRGGRLLTLRRRRALHALRALAAGLPSAAGEGPPLPYKYNKRARSTKQSDCHHCHHCKHCHHTNNNRSSSPTKPTSELQASTAVQCDTNKVEAGVQTSGSHQQPDTNSISKRKRDSTSSEDAFQAKVVTVATIHSPGKPHAKRSKNSTSSIQSPKKVEKLKRKRQNSTSSSSNEDQNLASIKMAQIKSPSLKLRRVSPCKRKPRCSKSSKESDILTSRKPSDEQWRPNTTSKYLQPPSKKSSRKIDCTSNESFPSSAESSFETNKRRENPKRHKSTDRVNTIKHKPSSIKATVEESSKVTHDLGTKRPEESQSENYKVQSSQHDTCKELVIDERDVQVLRSYLQKNHPDEDLYRFDNDDEYKTMHFYRINPLVNVDRCETIARMMRSESQESQLRLVDFASKLGLTSTSQLTEPPRYRTRRKANKSPIEDTGTNKEDKENIEKPTKSKRNLGSEKVLRESINRKKKQEKTRNKVRKDDQDGKIVAKTKEKNISKQIDNTIETIDLSSDSDGEYNTTRELKKAKKRSAMKEYSSLEDHAIVSWVAMGGRASCVNGNRLWKQLQDQYQRITGQGRSWHSLRNRYLRYILPALGRMALPSTLQARLRAAAAAGELKTRKLNGSKEPRRNSMFAPPQIGASSRRLRPPPSPSPSPSLPRSDIAEAASPPSRTPPPRYSSLTREFSNKHRARLRSSERSSADARNKRESPTRKSRQKSPSVSTRRRSNRLKSQESGNFADTPRGQLNGSSSRPKLDQKSPTDRNRRRPNRLKSQESGDSADNSRGEVNGYRSRSPGPKSGRKSPTDRNRRRSNRLKSQESGDSTDNSRGQLNRSSSRRQSGRKSPTNRNRRRSNTLKSTSSSSRDWSDTSDDSTREASGPVFRSLIRISRRESPTESRRRSNRRKSPSGEPLRGSSDSDDDSTDRRKPQSLRRKSTEPKLRSQLKSPSKSSKQQSPSKSSKQQSPSELSQSPSTRRLLRKDKSPPTKPRSRKLFNHRALL